MVKGDGSFSPGWDIVQADSSGRLTCYYQLDGITGVYLVESTIQPGTLANLSKLPLAATSFMDADIDFSQCRNDLDDDNVVDHCEWSPGSINQINSKYAEGDAVPHRLFHRIIGDPANGSSHTMVFDYEFSKGDIYAYDFLTNVDQTMSGLLLEECGDLPGFVPANTCSDLFSGPDSTPLFRVSLRIQFDDVSQRRIRRSARNFESAAHLSAQVSVPRLSFRTHRQAGR
jgi:hypothetical protein